MNEKAVLLSIQPKWCGLIANGKKTIEVRKTRPKIDNPFKCYIYQSKSKDLLMYVMVTSKNPQKYRPIEAFSIIGQILTCKQCFEKVTLP